MHTMVFLLIFSFIVQQKQAELFFLYSLGQIVNVNLTNEIEAGFRKKIFYFILHFNSANFVAYSTQ